MSADWICANDAADALAKAAAHSHRAPLHMRRRIANAREACLYGRALLGMVTHASQNYHTTKLDENGIPRTHVIRDSQGKQPGNAPKDARKRREGNKSCNDAPSAADPQTALTEGERLGIIDRGINAAANRIAKDATKNSVQVPTAVNAHVQRTGVAIPAKKPSSKPSHASTARQKAKHQETVSIHRRPSSLRTANESDLLTSLGHNTPHETRRMATALADTIRANACPGNALTSATVSASAPCPTSAHIQSRENFLQSLRGSVAQKRKASAISQSRCSLPSPPLMTKRPRAAGLPSTSGNGDKNINAAMRRLMGRVHNVSAFNIRTCRHVLQKG